ncbi:unnamed protein product [Phaedon cochleariae]|uniref:Ciliogenesis-associated TTC17-interacting protein N-terminal domain-containing protein n=1 Tax=Phaedon cochleariae TaxID=80249 RepID=A0A9P0DHM2_PHACE|nr:unnamed protein product [Phaedon cochleariae]
MESNKATFEEAILSYLKGQELWPEDDFEVKPPDDNAEENVEELIKELVMKVNKRIACKDRYENLKQLHNQYPLFDLNDYFSDFCMDEELMEKLSFRETLLISELDATSAGASGSRQESEPTPVGGLCLHVEVVDAYMPDQRMNNVDMDREIFQIYKRAKQALRAEKLEDYADDKMDEELRRTLLDYESFLRNETKANVKKFAVHLSSQFSIEGGGKQVKVADGNAGSRITAWVDRNFHTLEEKRTEYFTDEEGQFNEKSLYVALQKNKYYLRTTSSPPDIQERKYYGLGKTHDFVGEGASFILMRYLAVTRYTGSLELSTTYINGDMCRNIYECTGPKMGSVNDKNMEVCKIYRYIIEKCGIEHHCVTVLTVHGQIISQEWEGCNFILNINPVQYVDDGKPCPYDRLILEKTWIDDMELLSKYLDCKTEAELKMKTYSADHPEMKDILADYLNNILLLKPENILTFTMDFFESLCPIKIARMGYMDQDNRPTNDYYRMP